MGRTLFDKIFDDHMVADLGDGYALIHVDRHMIHDLLATGPLLVGRNGYPIRNPELTFAVADHTVGTEPGTDHGENPYVENLERLADAWDVRLFQPRTPGFGIAHITAADLGLVHPGSTFVVADSHACTLGALGAMAWGVSDAEHILATQTSAEARPRNLRLTYEGTLPPGITAKDLILHTVRTIGVDGATGQAIEYAGPAITTLSVEGRMTVCNMSIEMGAPWGLVAPDSAVLDYLAGRPGAPVGALWERACGAWGGLTSDPDARFDGERSIDVSSLAPQISWGTNPSQVIAIDERVPGPSGAADALSYMGLEPGQFVLGLPVDVVFLGSCTNNRISDLRVAARALNGRKVANGVRAWVVPGSHLVQKAAEAEGLDRLFRQAGFHWREPGCSSCTGQNGEIVEPGRRAVSTINRNFVGRQGPGARTHLASPVTAVAAAVTGTIADPRALGMEA